MSVLWPGRPFVGSAHPHREHCNNPVEGLTGNSWGWGVGANRVVPKDTPTFKQGFFIDELLILGWLSDSTHSEKNISAHEKLEVNIFENFDTIT